MATNPPKTHRTIPFRVFVSSWQIIQAFRCSRYQSMVRLRPARKSVVARKPNASSAREVSSRRRGWPSGFVGSNTSRPEYPVSPATVWRWVREGKFPKPYKLGTCVTVWDIDQVNVFIKQRAEAVS